MKRLIGLAVLFAVLYLCAPSYGTPSYYFLIYNVSTSVKGANNTSAASIPLKGYLVLKFVDGCDSPYDANLILYGKDKLNSNQPTYVQLNSQTSNNNLALGAQAWWQGAFQALTVWNLHDSPFYFEIYAIGKGALKDIGFSSLKNVSSSLKGPISVWSGMLLDQNDNIIGTGSVSLSLWLPATKYVNQNNWTSEIIIDVGTPGHNGLIPPLENKGFIAATLP